MQPLESLSTSSLRGFVNELCNRDFFVTRVDFFRPHVTIHFLNDIALTKSFHIKDFLLSKSFCHGYLFMKVVLFYPGTVIMCDFTLEKLWKQYIPKYCSTI